MLSASGTLGSLGVSESSMMMMEHMSLPLEKDLCQYDISWSSFENLRERMFVGGEGMRQFAAAVRAESFNVA